MVIFLCTLADKVIVEVVLLENNLKYFLSVAEELNITRAAEKNYISQQSMSMHIKRLESSMNIVLFNRKPNFSLTPAGEMLFETLNQIKILENNLLLRLNDNNKEVNGSIVVGISHSRSNIIMPDIMSIYKKKWPKIKVILQQDSTSENLENRIIRGYLDLFLGVGEISENENIEFKLLQKEKLYLIISENMLQKYITSENPTFNKNDISSEIDLSLFRDVPFIIDLSNELSAKIYSRYFEIKNLSLFSIFKCDDAMLRTSLCSKDIGATILVELMVQYAHNYNLTTNKNKLQIYPIQDLTVSSIIAYHKDKFLTAYAKDFIDIAIYVTNNYCNDFNNKKYINSIKNGKNNKNPNHR